MRILLFERFMEDKRNINPDPTYLQVINQNVCPKYIDRCLGNTNLLTLALHNVTFTNDSFILMIEQLKYNTYITALSLDQNRLTELAGKKLGKMLKRNTHLKRLDLSSNFFNNDGASYIANALNFNSSLQSLDLKLCNIYGNSIHELSEALKQNSSLKHLDISHNPLKNMDRMTFCNALKINSSIITLNAKDALSKESEQEDALSKESEQEAKRQIRFNSLYQTYNQSMDQLCIVLIQQNMLDYKTKSFIASITESGTQSIADIRFETLKHFISQRILSSEAYLENI